MASKKTEEVAKSTGPQELQVAPDYGDYAGSGWEGTTQDDFAIPFLNLLQPMSPQVSGESALDGARPGMLVNSVTNALYGEAGMIFVPSARQHVFVEWRPRDSGGGIVARHEPNSDVVQTAKASGLFNQLTTPDGNELIETFYLLGYTLGNSDDQEPGDVICIPFWSTKIKRYRAIMYQLNSYKGRPPLFAHRLRITSSSEKNNQGTFYNYDIAPVNGTVGTSLIAPSSPLIEFGHQLAKQVQAGETKTADNTVSDIPF